MFFSRVEKAIQLTTVGGSKEHKQPYRTNTIIFVDIRPPKTRRLGLKPWLL